MYVDMIQDQEDLSLQLVYDSVAITWASVNSASNSYNRDVLKIEPATKDSDCPTFQKRAGSKIIMYSVWGHFNKESLKAFSLKRDIYQWNILVGNGSGVKCDGTTMIKFTLDSIQLSTMIGTDY